jgi:hypothetical protein
MYIIKFILDISFWKYDSIKITVQEANICHILKLPRLMYFIWDIVFKSLNKLVTGNLKIKTSEGVY